MKKIKVSKQELKNIQLLALQQKCVTGRDVPVKATYSGKILMVQADASFLSALGF